MNTLIVLFAIAGVCISIRLFAIIFFLYRAQKSNSSKVSDKISNKIIIPTQRPLSIGKNRRFSGYVATNQKSQSTFLYSGDLNNSPNGPGVHTDNFPIDSE